MKVRMLARSDLDAVVGIHNAAFPGFFLTRLGSGFLRHYYETFLNEEFSSVIVEEEGRVAGFAVGYDSAAEFYKKLRGKSLQLAVSIIFALFQPGILKECLKKTLRSLFKGNVNEIPNKPIGYNELASIAVSKEYEGVGVGRKLLSSYMGVVKNECGVGILLTTDKINNQYVIDFYEKQGFEVISQFKQGESREMLCMVYRFDITTK